MITKSVSHIRIMWSQIILVVIVLSSFVAEVPGFYTLKFFTRTDGDALLYTQTKVTIPSQEFKFHELRFTWLDPTQMITQVIFECNRNCTVMLFAEEGDSDMTIYGMSRESKQLISTVFVYGMAIDSETLKEVVIPED